MMSLLTTVAVPYIVFEAVLEWFRHTFGGVDFKLVWANPHWPMWYLSALFFWRLATPLFKRLPGKVVVAVAVSLGGGLYATNVLDNARILGLLPFFVLGLKMHEGHWNLLRTRRARWYGTAVLLVMFVAARFTHLSMEWFYWRSRYDQIDASSVQQAFVIRMCLLLAGLVGAFAFFAVVPRTRTWFSALGSATLVVYLFHGFFVLGAEFAGAKPWAADHWPLSLLLITGLAVALALLLAATPVSSRLNAVVDPVGWVSRRRRGRGPSSA
jgi:fucose 4-O-acetylase-like acetyltransferase